MRVYEETAPPLHGVRVLDLTDEYGAYAGRLLAGLGAEVIRVPRDGQAQGTPPYADTAAGRVSLYDEYVNAGKISVEIEDDTDGAGDLERLVESVDVVLDSSEGRVPGGWLEVNETVVHVAISPFGWSQSPPWDPVDDLIVMGSGGLLHLGGYSDTGPVVAFGNQSYIAAGIFGAVAALVGLIEREATGEGNFADVSAQEVMAQALEDSLPSYVLTGELRDLQGDMAREAATGVYACQDGYVSMVAGRLGTARAWASLVEWLAEEHEDGHELAQEQWSQFTYRQTPEANRRFREIFEDFASNRPKETLYLEAQRRGIALSPVSDVEDLLQNEQLTSRGFFREFHHSRLGTKMIAPGPPFRLSRSAQPDLGEEQRVEGVEAVLGGAMKKNAGKRSQA